MAGLGSRADSGHWPPANGHFPSLSMVNSFPWKGEGWPLQGRVNLTTLPGVARKPHPQHHIEPLSQAKWWEGPQTLPLWMIWEPLGATQSPSR